MTTATSTAILDHQPARVGAWIQARGGGYWREGVTAIGLERDGALVAGAMFDYYNGASIVACVAVDGPITREWLYRICHYAFVQLGVNVVLGIVAGDNVKSQTFCERFGFRLSATIPDADPSGAMHLYTLRRDQCRYLRRLTHG